MGLFKRHPQQIITMDEKTLEEAITSAMRKVDAEREIREGKAFEMDNTAMTFKHIISGFFFLLAFFMVLALITAFVGFLCDGIEGLESLHATPIFIKILIVLIIVIFGSGAFLLGISTQKIKNRNYMLAYSSTLMSMVSLILALYKMFM